MHATKATNSRMSGRLAPLASRAPSTPTDSVPTTSKSHPPFRPAARSGLGSRSVSEAITV
jgi:hypothetical protein